VLKHDITECGSRPGEIARELSRLRSTLEKREPERSGISILPLQAIEFYRPAIDPRRGPRLEAIDCKAKLLKLLSEFSCGSFAGSSGGDLCPEAHVNATAKERPRGQDHSSRKEGPTIQRGDTVYTSRTHHKLGNGSLREREIRLPLEE
jgi:hypothetical protein